MQVKLKKFNAIHACQPYIHKGQKPQDYAPEQYTTHNPPKALHVMTTLKGLKEENHVIVSLRLAAGSSKEISRKGKGKDTHLKRHMYIIKQKNEQNEPSLTDDD